MSKRNMSADAMRDAIPSPLVTRDLNLIARAVNEARKRELGLLPQLSDTVPPSEPPAISPVDSRPQPHRVSAWRHDGGMTNTNHGTLEAARDHAATLSYVLFWKYAVVALVPFPRVLETKSIAEPVS